MIEPPLQIAGNNTRPFVGATQSSAASTNWNIGGGWWVSRPYKSDPFVGAARFASRPCCSICRGGWCLSTRARYCRGGSTTSRPYKKFEPLLKIVFYVVLYTLIYIRSRYIVKVIYLGRKTTIYNGGIRKSRRGRKHNYANVPATWTTQLLASNTHTYVIINCLCIDRSVELHISILSYHACDPRWSHIINQTCLLRINMVKNSHY